jgi:hypothetical protein
VFDLVALLHDVVPNLDVSSVQSSGHWPVKPLTVGQQEAHTMAELARRALLASSILRPLLRELPEDSRTFFDARKIVDRLDFDGRELVAHVGRLDVDQASRILADIE